MRQLAIKVGLATLAYLAPLHEIFIVMMAFVLVDLVTGIIASNKGGIPRSSRRLRKSIIKLISYITAMLLCYSAEKAFQVEWFVAHRAIGAFICAVEFISILENLAVITEHPVFMRIVKWIRGKAQNSNSMINDILDEKNDLDITGRHVNHLDRVRGCKNPDERNGSDRDGYGTDHGNPPGHNDNC